MFSWGLYVSECILTGLIGLVAVTGDRLVENTSSQTHEWRKALLDNATHGLIGILTWSCVALHIKASWYIRFIQIVECGFLASLIDIDHFIEAGSWNIDDAVSLHHRAFFHCTSIPVVVGLLAIIFGWHPLAWWILLAAVLSHHLRDANRRGLWLWPFGSTPPLPYRLYLTCCLLLPHLVSIPVSRLHSTSVLFALPV